MALPGHIASYLLSRVEPQQVQPAGVDLRVGEVHEFVGAGVLGKHSRKLPATARLEPDNGVWRLRPGAYKIVFMDFVRVPSTAVGFCFPRSSLLRSGVSLSCAVWDPGYYGRGEALLHVLNPHGFVLEAGARVAQLVYVELRGFGGVYSGRYLGENVG